MEAKRLGLATGCGATRWGLAAVTTAALGAAGCGINNPSYYSMQDPIEVGGQDPASGMARPGAGSGRIQIRYRAPSPDDLATLGDDSAKIGYEAPWIRRADVGIEVIYTVTNLDKTPGRPILYLTGANELFNYDSPEIRAALEGGGAIVNGMDEVLVLPLLTRIFEKPLAPGESVRGIIQEDEIAEAALDLDAMTRWMATPASVLINRSEVNPVGLEMMPPNPVVPGFQWLTLTFKAPTHMKCEFLLRVRDGKGRLFGGDDTSKLFDPTPEPFPYAMGAP